MGFGDLVLVLCFACLGQFQTIILSETTIHFITRHYFFVTNIVIIGVKARMRANARLAFYVVIAVLEGGHVLAPVPSSCAEHRTIAVRRGLYVGSTLYK